MEAILEELLSCSINHLTTPQIYLEALWRGLPPRVENHSSIHYIQAQLPAHWWMLFKMWYLNRACIHPKEPFCMLTTRKLMEKNSPQAVCGRAQIHKRLLFTPRTLSVQTKGLSFLFQNLNFFQTHSDTEASKSKLVTFWLFSKQVGERKRGDSGRPGMRQFVWCECVFSVITLSGWVPTSAW